MEQCETGLDVPLAVHALRIEAETRSALALPGFAGPKLRGGFFGALREKFCANLTSPSCAACELHSACPIARLAATVADDNVRGQETPRPFVLRPMTGLPDLLAPGRPFGFDLYLFGDGLNLFPYVLQALLRMGSNGIGERGQAPGRFTVQRVVAINPLTGAEQAVYVAGERQVRRPSVGVTQEQVRVAAAALPADAIALRFATPLRLKAGNEVVRTIAMRPLIQRLLRRLTDLCAAFGSGPVQADFAGLLVHAETVRTVDDRTRWVHLESHSSRTGGISSLGGLAGEARFAGDLRPLRELLVWLSLVSAGKSTTRGNGVVEILPQPAAGSIALLPAAAEYITTG